MLNECYAAQVKNRANDYEAEKSRQYIEKAAKWLINGNKNGLMFAGTVGSGKTTLFNATSRMISMLYPSQKLAKITALDLARIAQIDMVEFNRYCEAEILFIDDIGQEPIVKNFGNEISPILELIFRRYDKQMFTVITTNLSSNQIQNIYGLRIADRFVEMFDVISFNISSFRK